MRRKLSHIKLGGAALSSVALLSILGAAQVLPLMRHAAPVSAQSQAAPASSPTPSTKAPAPAPPGRHGGRRDLSRYEKAGPFAVGADLPRPARQAVMAQIRAFLLDHWRGRRLGHLLANFGGPDGRTEATAFYVEPDAAGAWTITLETDAGAETFTFVEEVEMPESGPPVIGGGAEGGRPGGSGKALHLKQSKEALSGLVF